ncbi:hypothetical protein MTR67_040225 [Solanum verrucosum]|uniref:Uncharacterized protein n=1 Tax=Solanum verrucosum TaxID=315347 RepID=A0AAF0UI83_SOLVR|nr:hypothetical protein MTR67_040225 [Solanum verrucosum]
MQLASAAGEESNNISGQQQPAREPATGETVTHQQQRQQRTSEILASPFLSSPAKFDFKDGSQQIRPRLATEEVQHLKKLIQDYSASFIKVGDKEKELGRTPIEPEVFKKTHVRKKENESDPDVWVEERAERTFSGLEGIGSSRQAEALDGVQIAAMSAQINKFTTALTESEWRRVAEQESKSETVQQIKEQVMNLARRPTTSSLDDTDDESDDDDYVEPTS